VTRRFVTVYDKYFDAIGATPKRTVAALCILAYAVLAATAAVVFVADDWRNAMAAGCVAGAWVFGAFNITMLAMTPSRSAVSNYPPVAFVCDVLYGTCATSLLFLAQHAARVA
jgi:hypothetical protein